MSLYVVGGTIFIGVFILGLWYIRNFYKCLTPSKKKIIKIDVGQSTFCLYFNV